MHIFCVFIIENIYVRVVSCVINQKSYRRPGTQRAMAQLAAVLRVIDIFIAAPRAQQICL